MIPFPSTRTTNYFLMFIRKELARSNMVRMFKSIENMLTKLAAMLRQVIGKHTNILENEETGSLDERVDSTSNPTKQQELSCHWCGATTTVVFEDPSQLGVPLINPARIIVPRERTMPIQLYRCESCNHMFCNAHQPDFKHDCPHRHGR